ncbi:hypothetical protein EJB05_38417, partial [Eragrostis curvula]
MRDISGAKLAVKFCLVVVAVLWPLACRPGQCRRCSCDQSSSDSEIECEGMEGKLYNATGGVLDLVMKEFVVGVIENRKPASCLYLMDGAECMFQFEKFGACIAIVVFIL